MSVNKKGKVALVGAGPGEAGLITLRAVECIGQAEVLVYDRLLDSEILAYAKPTCEKIYVGKQSANHAASQDEINRLLLSKALEGRRVVRLKGGDPYVFGRGGEEAMFLWEHGVAFEVVPGVTSAVAAPCFGGIPVTHRDYASSFHVIAGNRRDACAMESIDWPVIARLDGTLVFLMGLANLDEIARRLLQNGMAPDMPAAVVSQAGSPRQKTLCAPLRDIARETAVQSVASPAVFVVGRTAALHQTLGFYERRPLFGKTVLLTGRQARTGELYALLAEAGARVIRCPVTRICPAAFDEGVYGRLARYTFLVFTSRHAVDIFFSGMFARGMDARRLAGLKIAVVGASTMAAAARYGIRADIAPGLESAQGLAECLGHELESTDRVLFPHAGAVSGVLGAEMGRICEVEEMILYNTVPDEEGASRAADILRGGEADIAVFASASAVDAVVGALGARAKALLSGVRLASIGPSTSRHMLEIGLPEPIQAGSPSESALAQAILG